jgi:hypothetical protein
MPICSEFCPQNLRNIFSFPPKRRAQNFVIPFVLITTTMEEESKFHEPTSYILV